MISTKSPSAETLKTLETVPSMCLILSPDLYILTATDLYLHAIKTRREAIVGKHIFDAFPLDPRCPEADGVRNINASLQEVLRTRKAHKMPVQRYDVPDRNNNGEFLTRYWDPSHTPILDEQGDILYIIQLATNVTEKVLAELELETAKMAHEETKSNLENEQKERYYSERNFTHLADLVPAKISSALPRGEITYLNQKWLDYSGLNFEDLCDFGYHNMMHPDEIEEFQKNLMEAKACPRPYESEMRFRNKDGEYRWHLNIASPVLDENGEIKMWVCSTTDIQRMKEEEQRKNDFIGMVSHELRTPLTILSAYLQVMEAKFGKDEGSREHYAIKQAGKQTAKMAAMINGFLELSRLESCEIQLKIGTFDINKLLEETIDEMLLLTSEHQVYYSPCEVPLLSGDREKIGYVINNLISNACKYSKAGTAIQVNCKIEDNQVTVSVRDNGIGIRQKDIHRLFNRYYRVENNTTVSGFGVGLYLCTEIVKRHHGKIWAESEYGEGSTFYFSLPIGS